MPRRPSARSPSITSQESYSAVMITDLIADVPVNLEVDSEHLKQAKEVNNLAYDTHLDGEMTSPSDASPKTNGAGISRGVILNAVQFGQNDSKTKSDEKSIQLTASLQAVPEIKQTVLESKGFKDMSFLRKVVFGFSFLPSILFVLCFAIILPCNLPKPCIDEVWMVEFNNTELTSKLEVPADVLFTAVEQDRHLLIKLDKNKGESSEIVLEAKPTYLKCGKIRNKDTTHCIVIDETGRFYYFKDDQDKSLWNTSEIGEQASSQIILPGCNDGMEDIAVAVTNATIKILTTGNDLYISECDSAPDRLMPWATNGSSNIVFICKQGGKDKLISVPKNAWCSFAQESPMVLPLEDLDQETIIQPLKDGIVKWKGNETSMIQSDGTYLWTVFNLSVPEENRFVLQGNFYGENEQIAFFGSNLSSGLKVILLDPLNGSLVHSFSQSDSEATEVIHLKGKKRDFALILLRKISKDAVAVLDKINDISKAIVTLISNEAISTPSQVSISEEIALLDLDVNSIDTIKSIKDKVSFNRMTAVSNKDTGILSIYLVSTSEDPQQNNNEISNIDVANWDKSTKSKCKI